MDDKEQVFFVAVDQVMNSEHHGEVYWENREGGRIMYHIPTIRAREFIVDKLEFGKALRVGDYVYVLDRSVQAAAKSLARWLTLAYTENMASQRLVVNEVVRLAEGRWR